MPCMSLFASKAAPTSEKIRGGYYTPGAIARFLGDWVGAGGPRLLEPSCGDGAILRELARRSEQAVGVELDPGEATKARDACPGIDIVADDFFTWFEPKQRGAWDGVAGNPPFIRFQHWTEPTRAAALDVMRSVGLRPTRLTNAWVPFVVASALAIRDGGRLGLVVPGEVMQVTYAAQLRAFLVDELSELTIVSFRDLVLDGILQEVVLLLGVRGRGPAQIKVVEATNLKSLPEATRLTMIPHAPALRHDKEKWTKYFLDPPQIEALREARADGGLTRLGEVADVDVGIVTGRNRFFVMRPSSGTARKVEEHLLPLVSKSAHLSGTRFSSRDLAALETDDAPCRLLAVEESTQLDEDDALQSYVRAGEAENVHQGYKCSIRKRWWVVPSVWVPDAFLLRQIYDHPRLIANHAGAMSTDTVHRVRILNGVAATSVASASVNSATFAFAEVMGRSYGGGVLELEPREAEALPFPDASKLSDEHVEDVDRLVRAGRLLEAVSLVDRVLLIDHHGFSRELVRELRGTWARLRDRRLRRGRKQEVNLSATGATDTV